ncbi:phosphatase PAP2 family protein [Deinococcus ruber]|uniref:Phosphatase PAP2 family protein n=1 Tax=Deinococcus ruber TaxID=1848197 RepID=A0A918C050_9DEIO|nr:phosphatase PAP2 family protein [Deinococcus ruber]GGQ98549.1 phosphatase PAP2 family protein [Deinococcus ruber]
MNDLVRTLHQALDHPEQLWLAITMLGRDEVFIVLLALYSWLVNPEGMRRLGVAFSLSYLTNSALKYGLNLPRPFAHDPALASAAAKATAGGPGLPSGHAQLSASLWFGMAWQLAESGRGRRWVWVLAAVVVLLVSLSRLVLGVHYPSDVLIGLLIGVLFAWLAAARLALLRWNVWFPLLLLVGSAFLPSSTPREFAVGLGLLAGFWLLRHEFAAPSTWAGRVGVAVIGLALVFAVYFGLAAVLPQGVRESGLGRALRYALLVLMAGEGVPRLLKFWLPVSRDVTLLIK